MVHIKMGKDRKHMKRLREKRVKSVSKQIDEHEDKIEYEKPIKDTTKDYWKKEIDKKFSKQKNEDREYLEEH